MLAARWFEDIPPIAVRDPLLKVLGPSDDGTISYGYDDAVRAAGHSCPTVAGAFLMAAKGLARLYPDGAPERGAIRVEMRDGRADGVTGVQARILCLITGAAEEDGFKGMLGQFDRRNLLGFNAPISGQVRLTRIDTGASVELEYHADAVPAFVSPRPVMQKVLAGTATEDEKSALRELWQSRVHNILTAHQNPNLIVVVDGPARDRAPQRKWDRGELRDLARRYAQAARHALTPEFRQRFAELAHEAAQQAEAAVCGEAASDGSAPAPYLMTALHLRDRAAYCRRCADAVACTSLAIGLRQVADEYERDAGRLEQSSAGGHP